MPVELDKFKKETTELMMALQIKVLSFAVRVPFAWIWNEITNGGCTGAATGAGAIGEASGAGPFDVGADPCGGSEVGSATGAFGSNGAASGVGSMKVGAA